MNKSGLRLSYWVDGPEGRSEAFSVNSWEEGPLHVEPVEKTVVLTDTQLQVSFAAMPGPFSCAGAACLAAQHYLLHDRFAGS